MIQDELIAAWRREEIVPFGGWDFSHLRRRMEEEEPPWSYEEMAQALMAGATNMLDIGTGGGERLLSMRDTWPTHVIVTEDYAPNVKLAGERLRPYGVEVVESPGKSRTRLPFADCSFDLVINRHTGFNLSEVARVLRPGGRYLTQQVDYTWGYDLILALGGAPKQGLSTLTVALHYLHTKTELELEVAWEHTGSLTFTDVGAIVYYLKAIPWIVEGFSVDTHLTHLLALHTQLKRGEPLRYHTRRYLLRARKPALISRN